MENVKKFTQKGFLNTKLQHKPNHDKTMYIINVDYIFCNTMFFNAIHKTKQLENYTLVKFTPGNPSKFILTPGTNQVKFILGNLILNLGN